MVGVRKFEHAHVSVPNVEETTAFYEEFLGLETHSEGDIVRLTPVAETHYDLYANHHTIALEEGTGGLEHVAVRVTEDELDSVKSRLTERDETYEIRDGVEPGHRTAIRIILPGGLPVDLTVVENATDVDRHDILPQPKNHHTPKGADHITLASPNVKADAEFLRDVLGFRISDVAMAGPDTWGMAFTRWGDHHHDVAFIMDPTAERTGLHHVAWQMMDLNHMKQFIDVLCKSGHEIEIDFTRHVLGNNVSVYFPDPAGNRLEITTETTSLDPDTPTTFHHEPPDEIVTFWDGTHPPIGEDAH